MLFMINCYVFIVNTSKETMWQKINPSYRFISNRKKISCQIAYPICSYTERFPLSVKAEADHYLDKVMFQTKKAVK